MTWPTFVQTSCLLKNRTAQMIDQLCDEQVTWLSAKLWHQCGDPSSVELSWSKSMFAEIRKWNKMRFLIECALSYQIPPFSVTSWLLILPTVYEYTARCGYNVVNFLTHLCGNKITGIQETPFQMHFLNDVRFPFRLSNNSNSLLYQQPPVPRGWGYYDRVNLTIERT